jgi:hypothetical protein
MPADSLQEQEGVAAISRDRAKDSKILGNSMFIKNSEEQRKTAKCAPVFCGIQLAVSKDSAAKPMSLAVNFGKNSENSDEGFEVTMGRETRRGRLPLSLLDLTAAPSAD